jgi:hypothetical protein
MLIKIENAVIRGAEGATGFNPYHPCVPGRPGIWTYRLPMVTGQARERASRAHRKHGTPRWVPRRSNGNSLPLIGLRPAVKLKRQCMSLGGSFWEQGFRS